MVQYPGTTLMKPRSLIACSLGIVLIGAGLFALSCCPLPPSPPPDPYWLISLGAAQTVTADQALQAHDALVQEHLGARDGLGSGTTAWYDKWLEALKKDLEHSIDCYPIRYWSRDANSTSPDDRAIELTGMLYIPKPKWYTLRPRTVSLIAYPHGTELKRDRVPSNNSGDEWPLGAIAALLEGFAVAMPDLPGMGGADPNKYHPYCHANSLAYSVVDMIRAVNEAFEIDLRDRYSWNGRLYILGYSEGGYAALATVKELQLHADDYPGLSITGSACLAGPQDLTGAMRKLMIDPDHRFGRPFFLPYMIWGYNAVYPGEVFDPHAAMTPVLMPDLATWMDGSLEGDDVDKLVEERMGVAKGQVIPLDMMSPDWVASQLADDVYQTSPVGQILAANNLYDGWAPNRPMLIMQSPDDDCVPYANSVTTYNAFVAAGAGHLVTFHNIGWAGAGITHVEGAVIGIPSAIMWIKDVCPKH